jgi:hypothetical protein
MYVASNRGVRKAVLVDPYMREKAGHVKQYVDKDIKRKEEEVKRKTEIT